MSSSSKIIHQTKDKLEMFSKCDTNHSATKYCYILMLFSVNFFQGWLNIRSVNEQSIIMELFDKSFNHLLNYATTTFTFKMDVLESFMIVQVRRKTCDK